MSKDCAKCSTWLINGVWYNFVFRDSGMGEKLVNGVYYFFLVTQMVTHEASGIDSFTLWPNAWGVIAINYSICFLVFILFTMINMNLLHIFSTAKQTTHFFFSFNHNKTIDPFEFIHFNVWGAYHLCSYRGAFYLLFDIFLLAEMVSENGTKFKRFQAITILKME